MSHFEEKSFQKLFSGLSWLGIFLGLWAGAALAIDAPAPWTLKGDGYIIVSDVSKEENLDGAFINEGLRDRYEKSLTVTMLVDYQSSPVGPYQELLYIPGTFRFADGKSHPSISKIYVSSQSSVDNGRKNWGIPKELASFTRDSAIKGKETVRVSVGEQEIASFTVKTFGPKLPISTFPLPPVFRTLGQELNGQTYVFELKAKGWAELATLEETESEPRFFPELKRGKVLLVLKVSDFSLVFPEARTFSSSGER